MLSADSPVELLDGCWNTAANIPVRQLASSKASIFGSFSKATQRQFSGELSFAKNRSDRKPCSIRPLANEMNR